MQIVHILHICNAKIQGQWLVWVPVSVGVGVPGLVKDPSCRREETVHVGGGFRPDGPQSPAKGEIVKKPVTGMGGLATILPGIEGCSQSPSQQSAWYAAVWFFSLAVAAAYQTMMEEVGGAASFLKSMTISTVFRVLSFF